MMIGQGRAAPAAAREADEAIAELYVHYDKLVRIAFLMTGDLRDAEDAVQDAYMSVWLAWGRLRDSANGFAFLRRTVVNNCLSVRRHRAVADRNAPGVPQDAPSAEHEALVQLGRSALVAALGRLSPRQRQVIVLRYYGGLSEADIAEVLGIRQGSVKSHAARGIAALHAILTAPDGSRRDQGSRPDSGGFAGILRDAPKGAWDIICIP
jgi:RNA polymerase sigma-70 factor (sigma-E family)